jgi:holo-[acyl-carrier protein] synthase
MNIGIDIEEISRFAGVDIGKIFSFAEQEYIKQKNGALQTVAGLYCAKEAYFKAVGTGLMKSKLQSVEIAHDKNGKPYYKNDLRAALSIAHTKTVAIAVCLIL